MRQLPLWAVKTARHTWGRALPTSTEQVNGYPLLDEETVTASSEDEEPDEDSSGAG
ncbi:hypothetical protein ACWGK6_14060 [Streptomyces violaceusniger]